MTHQNWHNGDGNGSNREETLVEHSGFEPVARRATQPLLDLDRFEPLGGERSTRSSDDETYILIGKSKNYPRGKWRLRLSRAWLREFAGKTRVSADVRVDIKGRQLMVQLDVQKKPGYRAVSTDSVSITLLANSFPNIKSDNGNIPLTPSYKSNDSSMMIFDLPDEMYEVKR